MFTKVQIYSDKEECCFNDIQNSKRPRILVNTDSIVSLGPATDWGFCDGHENYPFRILSLKDGRQFLCIKESADELEQTLLSLSKEQ